MVRNKMADIFNNFSGRLCQKYDNEINFLKNKGFLAHRFVAKININRNTSCVQRNSSRRVLLGERKISTGFRET